MAAMAVQHNMQSINANRLLGITTSQQKKSTEKLSSGYRINRAGDDAAGLAISEKMRGQIRGLKKASTNASDGISLIQTAEGGLNETHSILQRMRELAVQASTDTNTDDDREQIQNEINQLTQEVDRIANTTEFNTKKLLNGDSKGAVSEKAGTFGVEGSFQNSLVKVVISDKSSAAGRAIENDVIRIEFTEDVLSAGKLSGSIVNVTDIKGVASKDGTGKQLRGVIVSSSAIYIGANFFHEVSKSTGAQPGLVGDVFKMKMSAASGTTTGGTSMIKIAISGLGHIKAGDTITITLGEATVTEKAKTGKEALRLQVGANSGQEIMLGINSMRAEDLDISRAVTANKKEDLRNEGIGLKVTTQADASMAINQYDQAIKKVSSERAKLGSVQNRLEHTIDNLDSAAENTQAAESGIRDTDMASTMVEHSKNNILAQAGQSMLAQANQSTQGVLSLLG